MNRALNQYDILKASAILLVVFGHITILYNQNLHPEVDTAFWEKVTLAIYIFHMPLFMAISGAIYQIGFSKGKYRGFSKFVHSKILRIIVPYICIGLFVLIPTLVICNKEMGFLQPSIYWKMLIGIDNRHLWFLLALFWIFLFQYASDYVKIPTWLLFCLTTITASILSIFDVWSNVLDISQAIHYWPYFIMGILIEKYSQKIKGRSWGAYSFVCLFVCLFGYYLCNNLIVNSISITLLPCFIIVILSILASALQKALSYSPIKSYIVTLVNYSFGIYLFHVSVVFLMSHYCHGMDVAYFIPLTFMMAIVIPILIVAVLRRLNLHYVIGEKRFIPKHSK